MEGIQQRVHQEPPALGERVVLGLRDRIVGVLLHADQEDIMGGPRRQHCGDEDHADEIRERHRALHLSLHHHVGTRMRGRRAANKVRRCKLTRH